MDGAGDPPLSLEGKLELARQVFRELHPQCFWNLRSDLELQAEDLDEVIRGLRAHGGRRGFLLAARLGR
ncbi:MAG: hypothetical protein IT349_16480 [Candidatus Eisenbacteria bacterium]|nr:hypothetical protein [Candidatus Eisenbacteria bacterium]MCC7143697.1 hypothetical protein [Candidatus Eisenbacteria bacterium]